MFISDFYIWKHVCDVFSNREMALKSARRKIRRRRSREASEAHRNEELSFIVSKWQLSFHFTLIKVNVKDKAYFGFFVYNLIVCFHFLPSATGKIDIKI